MRQGISTHWPAAYLRTNQYVQALEALHHRHILIRRRRSELESCRTQPPVTKLSTNCIEIDRMNNSGLTLIVHLTLRLGMHWLEPIVNIRVLKVSIFRVARNVKSFVPNSTRNSVHFIFEADFRFLWRIDQDSLDIFRFFCLRHFSICLVEPPSSVSTTLCLRKFTQSGARYAAPPPTWYIIILGTDHYALAGRL